MKQGLAHLLHTAPAAPLPGMLASNAVDIEGSAFSTRP